MTHPQFARDSHLAAMPTAAVRSLFDTTQKYTLVQLRIGLLRHARLVVFDPSVAEDLVQDTLLAVMQQDANYRGEATLQTWSTAILRNKVADWYRSPDRRRIVQRDLSNGNTDVAVYASRDVPSGAVESAPSREQPENREERRQMMSVLERCIGCLPNQIGKVFMMREWWGFGTTEICERLQISQENSRKVLQRARSALRTCMQRNWIGKRPRA